MSDVTEGIGGMVEGALLGGAVEKERGSGIAGEPGEGACKNCGALPQGSFCQECGQKVHVHRTLSAIGHDLIHGVLHLDGKFWLTLPMLLFRPGKLTRRYIEGERAKFVSPMAMFLFSVFAMFAVFQMLGISAPTDLEGDTRAVVAELAESEARSISAKIVEIDDQLAQPDLDAARRVALETQRTTLERDRTLLEERGANLTRFLTTGDTVFLDDLETQGEARIAEAKERLDTLPEGSQEHADLAAEIARAEEGMSKLRNFGGQTQSAEPLADTSNRTFRFEESGVGWIDAFIKKWQTNPSLMLYKMQANAYKFSWLLIPLSIPFVWLTFAWRRRFRAYDHAIFVTYSLSFISLLFIALSVLGAAGVPTEGLVLAGALIPPIHIYKQLRGAYEIGRFSAFWRLLAISVFIWIVVILFLQSLAFLGAF